MTRTGVPIAVLAHLTDETPREEIRQRQGPGGKLLDYVDARFVMERLDDLVGPHNWQDQYVDRADGAVRCGISILIEGEWVTKWDIGDPTDIEGTKGSYSDAFKRAAVKWGIARDLYGHAPTTSGNGHGASPRPAAAAPSPRPAAPPPSAGAVPEEPDYLREADAIFGDVRQTTHDAAATQDGFCPDHGMAWVLKPGGISKASGKAYDPFWACPSQDRPYCKQKPSQRWMATKEVGR